MSDPKDFSRNAANNTSVGGVNIAEGAATADMNNSQRETLATFGTSDGSADFGSFDPAILIDHIGESTADAGVTIDGLLIKDGAIPSIDTTPVVSVTAADTTPDYLDGKIAVTGNITKEVANPGADEVITLNVPDPTPTNPLQLAQAWVNFNGSNGTIRSSFGVSGVVRNGTADYTISFSNPFAAADYAATVMGGNLTSDTTGFTFNIRSISVSSIRITVRRVTGTGSDPSTDPSHVMMTFFGAM